MHIAGFWLLWGNTQVSALSHDRQPWGCYLLTSSSRGKAENLGRKGSHQTSFFTLFPVPSVSLCILWPQIINIICYPGRHNKIQRHDSRLIKIWRGAKKKKNLLITLWNVVPRAAEIMIQVPYPCLLVGFILINHEDIKVCHSAARENASVLLTCKLCSLISFSNIFFDLCKSLINPLDSLIAVN